MIEFDGSREDAIARVTGYFDQLINDHPSRAKKLMGARRHQLSQVDVEIAKYCAMGQSEDMAIRSWVDGARRSADAKLR